MCLPEAFLSHFSHRLTHVSVDCTFANQSADNTSANLLVKCFYCFEGDCSNSLGFCHSSHPRHVRMWTRKLWEISLNSSLKGDWGTQPSGYGGNQGLGGVRGLGKILHPFRGKSGWRDGDRDAPGCWAFALHQALFWQLIPSASFNPWSSAGGHCPSVLL